MTALELMDSMGGDVLANKIRVVIDGEVVVVAVMEETTWVLTDRGAELTNEHPRAPAPKTRKSKAQLVESVKITDAAEVALGIDTK